jgi:signal transduction histidine kinase
VTGGEDARRAPLPADLDRLLHDLRGPLNAAVMHLEVLKRLLGDDPIGQESLQSVQREMERLTAMLPVAVSICAIEMGTRRRLPLRAVVESAIEDPLRKQVAIDAGPWPDVEGDERLLVLAVRQILLNAVESAGGDGNVRVSAEAGADDTVTVIVRDSGAGFGVKNPAARIRLMGGDKPGHVGVGLLLALRIARLHGGSLTFGTDGGVRVRFTVRVCPAA